MNKFIYFIRKRALLLSAVFCVAAVATVGVLSIGENEEEENPGQLVDLNEQDPSGENQQQADVTGKPENGDGQQVADDPDKPEDGDGQQVADNPDGTENPGENGDNQQVAENPGDTGNPGETGDDQQVADHPGEIENPGESGDNQQVADVPEKPEDGQGTEVLSPQIIAEQLTYNKADGLLWPVQGEILIGYSPEHAVYHSTLDQFSTSDAVVIASEVGTEVHAAAKGVIVSIEEDVRTGTTVTLAIGNNTQLVYGQLALSGLEEGDILEAGECIGTVAEPTRYYVEEGPNLYFQVVENAQSINPGELLRTE